MDRFESAALDRHITGNYGEDGVVEEQEQEQQQQTPGPRVVAESRTGAFVELSVSAGEYYGNFEQTLAQFSVYGGVTLIQLSTTGEPQRFTLTDSDMQRLITAYQEYTAKVRKAEAARRASDDLPF